MERVSNNIRKTWGYFGAEDNVHRRISELQFFLNSVWNI